MEIQVSEFDTDLHVANTKRIRKEIGLVQCLNHERHINACIYF